MSQPPPLASAMTGDMSALVRAFDWSSTPLGAQSSWPQSLRTLTDMLLAHPLAMIVLWGPDLVQIYNDAYRVIMGDKHPAGLGQPTRACWPEVWSFNAPIFEGVIQRSETFEFTDQRLVLSRHGQDEDAFFTLAFSPVRDETGGVGGVLVTVIETTERVRAQAEVQARARQGEEEAHAQQAFVAFTEAVGTETDVLALTQEAIRVLRSFFQADSTFVYYERDQNRWRARIWSDDLDAHPELLTLLRTGLPLNTPVYAEAARTRQPQYVEQWDAQLEQVAHSEAYGAAAIVPLVIDGEVRAYMALGLRHTHQWSERDRGVVRAVGRGLTLALERSARAQELRIQIDVAERQNEVLEAFARLGQHLALDVAPLHLIRQVQEVVLGLLPAGFSLYYEPDGESWCVRSQVGAVSTPELDAAVQRLPLTDTRTC